MRFILLVHAKQPLKFTAKMRGVALSVCFQIKSSFNLLLDPQEMVDIWRQCLAIERIVKITTLLANHVFKPVIVMLLQQITFNSFPKLPHNVDQHVLQDAVAKVLGSLILEETIHVEHVIGVVPIQSASECKQPNLISR